MARSAHFIGNHLEDQKSQKQEADDADDPVDPLLVC
jgi:hypothetical protein